MKTPASVFVGHSPSGLRWRDASDRGNIWDDLLLVGLGLVLAFAALAFGTVEPWSEFILECGAAGLFLLWAAGQIVQGELRLQSSPLFLPAAAFALLVAVQIVFGISVYRYASYQEAIRYIAYGLLMFVAVQCFQSCRQVQRFVIGMTAFGFLLSVFAIVQDMTSNGKIYWVRKPLVMAWGYGPYQNHSHWSGLIELLTPLPVALMMRHRATAAQKVLLGFALLIMGSTIFLAGSRGGMISFVVQVGFGAALMLLRGRSSERLRDVAILAVIGVVFLAWMGGSRVTRRIESTYTENDIIVGKTLDTRFRLAIDKDTLAMAGARPIAGWGLNCFTTVFPQFQTFYSDSFINAAHNDYLQLLAETGVIGFAIVLWFLIAMFGAALRRNGTTGFLAYAKLAALLGITGILVHSMVDFNLHIPANAALFYVLAALASLGEVEDSQPSIAHYDDGPVVIQDFTLS